MKRRGGRVAIFGSLRVLTYSAILAAMSIVLGKYLAISVGEFLRFSFENLPVIFAGIFFGPIVGAVVAIVADLLGCLLVGYAINPVVTLGAAVIGVSAGLLWKGLPKCMPHAVRVLLCVGVSHLLGSVLIKTVGLAGFYDLPLGLLMLWRLLNYAIVGGLEGFLVYTVAKSRAIQNIFRKDTER